MTTQQTTTDIQYMHRCLRLAAQGLGRTRPNPMVGCVVVMDGRIVSEGYHQLIGTNHAERNALLRLPNGAKGATLYVNLEPCSHQGRTPPCADLIVASGVKRVVCCNDDPNPLVSGRGFAKLKAAGIEVVRHVAEEEGRWLNRRFFTQMEQGRPYVILKWAESEDGYMAPATDNAYWLSTPRQNRLNHRWRTEEAAILVGSDTYLHDKPALTPRHYIGPAPQPVVVDRRGRLNDVPTHWLHLSDEQPQQVLATLHKHGIQSVIVEGGRKILDAFIEQGLYDEVRVLKAPVWLGDGLAAPDWRQLHHLHLFDADGLEIHIPDNNGRRIGD